MNRAPFRLLSEPDPDGPSLAFESELAARAASFRPRTGQLEEVRGTILAAFEGASRLPAPVRPRIWSQLHWGQARLPWRLGVATLALLLLAGSGQFASRAGEPGQVLYPARLAAEDLWFTTTAGQGWQGRFDRLDLRLRDAEAMAARGDVGGVDAALTAYASALADLDAVAAEPGSDTAGLAGLLGAHQRALAAVGAAVSGPAADLARREGEAVQRVLGQLRSGDGSRGTTPGGMRHDGRADADRPGWQGSLAAGPSGAGPVGGSLARSTAASSPAWQRGGHLSPARRPVSRGDRDRRSRWRR